MMMIRKNSDHVTALHPEIGQRLKDLIRERKLTQKLVAEACSVSPSAVHLWVKGESISLDSVITLAIALNVSLDWLVLGKKRI